MYNFHMKKIKFYKIKFDLSLTKKNYKMYFKYNL
jgi:hypothetical protein